MAKKRPQKPAETSKSPGKSLRDSAILSHSLTGKSNVAIAREMGIDRETVARVLSSEDVRRISQEIDAKLAGGIEKAVKNVLRKIRAGDAKMSVELLRNFGSMRSSIKLEHTGKDGAPLGQRSDEEIDARIKALLGKVEK